MPATPSSLSSLLGKSSGWNDLQAGFLCANLGQVPGTNILAETKCPNSRNKIKPKFHNIGPWFETKNHVLFNGMVFQGHASLSLRVYLQLKSSITLTYGKVRTCICGLNIWIILYPHSYPSGCCGAANAHGPSILPT